MEKQTHIADITPFERTLLSKLRDRPALYLGTPSLRDFNHMADGYQFAMQTVGQRERHNLLPEGLNEFTARYYGESLGGRNAFTMIFHRVSDDTEALEQFFVILDAYLVSLGYAPLGNERRADLDRLDRRTPDAEVTFRFNGTRRTPAADGYRPAHRIREDYLTTGVHHYFGVSEVAPDGTARGTITFITPESYPHTLWPGKVVPIQEGERVVGHATVEQVLNPILKK